LLSLTPPGHAAQGQGLVPQTFDPAPS